MHSKFGGSRISTIINCPGYVNAVDDLQALVNDDAADLQAAELGTAAHEAAEFCLVWGTSPDSLIGVTFNGHTVDAVMAENLKVYINHVNSLVISHGGKSLIEKKLVMSSISDQIFGYADHVLIANRTLFVTDLKYGFMVVSAKSAQLPFYGVAALDTYKAWFKIDKVVVTIVQPRADHVQGQIRSEEYTIEEMMQWRDKFANAFVQSQSPSAPRVAGEHCHYCPASATCRPRLIRTVLKASLDAPLRTSSDEEIESLLREIPSIRKHLERVEEHCLILARGGKLFNDFKLVKQRVHAVCTDEEALKSALTEKGVDPNVLYYPGRMKGKTTLKPELSAKGINVDDFFVVPEAQTKLVPITHSSVAVSRTARGVFKPIKDL